MKKYIKVILSILFISLWSCNTESVEPVTGNPEVIIEVDSELYNLIERVTGSSDTDEDIVCIDFVYPLTIFTYDADLVFLDSQLISSDVQFSELLSGLDTSYSISLSLPISSNIAGGTTVNISSYGELQEAIDDCLEQEFLTYCNERLPNCIWEVSYSNPGTNEYEDAYFDVDENGTVIFHHEGENYSGTWIMLILEDEVHLNINLDNNSIVAVDWNFDWLITLTPDGSFQLDNGSSTYVLEQNCTEACIDLVFEECEITVDSGVANFDLYSYDDCIISFLNLDPTIVSLTFHVTQIDAETDVNAINSIYNNTESPQTIFVRIENSLIGEITYATITLVAIAC